MLSIPFDSLTTGFSARRFLVPALGPQAIRLALLAAARLC